MGTRWIAFAAHAGPASIPLWLLTSAAFIVPTAIAVAALSVKYPKAGGMYLWTRGDFGAWHGFLCFWVYWMSIATWYPSAALFYMGAALHAVGLPASRLYVLPLALAAIWIALGSNLIGMKIGKWTENIGGASVWLVTGLFVVLAVLVWKARGPATPLTIIPKWNWNTVNVWATIIYAMTGLEVAGLIAGEVKDPARTFPQAGWLASGCATLFYGAATAALLVLLTPGTITEMNGLAEAGDEAARVLHASWLQPFVALLVLASGLGQLGGIGTAASRMPFAVASDGLLPAAFSRVHPRWHTPHVSVLTLAITASVLLVLLQLGDTLRGAYQELVSLMVITGLLPFGYIFASSFKAGHRISAISGLAMVGIALVCSVIPTDEIAHVWLYEGKLAAASCGVILPAWVVYNRVKRRKG